MRYKLTIEYDGSGFSGWQRQQNGRSIQQCLEEALAKFTGETPVIFGAGRTDAGVHALAQVAHFDLGRHDYHSERHLKAIQNAINHHLHPDKIVVVAVESASADFHARFSAIGKRYSYHIINRYAPPALDFGKAWYIREKLNIEAMQAAAALLLGKHDFTSFRDSQCQAKSPIRTLEAIAVRQQGDIIIIEVRAPSFLHHQVRIIVGTLKRIGDGSWDPGYVATILHAKSRALAGPTAPAHGLYLAEVFYGN